jgi:hypothetical protein
MRDGDLLRLRERSRYSAGPNQQRKAAAEYRRSDRGKKLNALAVQRYRERNREKYQAHIEVRKAIAAGILSKPQICELARLGGCDGRVEYHHPDYSKPLEVRALCLHHHNGMHLKPNVIPAPLLDYRPALGSQQKDQTDG